MSSTMNLIRPAKKGDIITHKTEHGTYTYTVGKINKENMPINFRVSYEEREDLE